MPRYQYVKSQPKRPMRRSIFVSFFLIGIGLGMVMWVSWPILSFRLFTAPLFVDIVSPVAERRSKVSGGTKERADLVYAASVDYTNENTWFPQKPQKKVNTKVTAYRLSIPKLTIKDSLVIIGGDNLNKSLIHYGGTAFPGQNGNAVIFGHSILPQFFDPRNYKSIFSTLPTLAIGDDLSITYDGVTYRYKVEEMVVRSPEDLSILEQPMDDSYVTLVTCVPPGTYWERLNVKARLVKI